MGGFNWEIYAGNPKLIKKLKEEIEFLKESCRGAYDRGFEDGVMSTKEPTLVVKMDADCVKDG